MDRGPQGGGGGGQVMSGERRHSVSRLQRLSLLLRGARWGVRRHCFRLPISEIVRDKEAPLPGAWVSGGQLGSRPQQRMHEWHIGVGVLREILPQAVHAHRLWEAPGVVHKGGRRFTLLRRPREAQGAQVSAQQQREQK